MTTSSPHNLFDSLTPLHIPGDPHAFYYSLPALEKAGIGNISRMPLSLRIVLEAVLRNYNGTLITEEHVRTLAQWNAQTPAQEEIPFHVARIVLQDFTGVPLLVDLAAMRAAVARLGKDPQWIEPLVPVDLVVDHSIQVDIAGSSFALERNLEVELTRNRERYEFLKWGQQAFETFQVVPPGIGIVHQVNLEYLAQGVLSQTTPQGHILYPDTLVGTDSHTTMINGMGIVGWGVGGIEAEAGMLGQPVYFLTPEVVGVHMTGKLKQGVTATDLALHVTEKLRQLKVVGKFVEFYGPGARYLPVPDRATIANMAPEYGATMGYFPVDEETIRYFQATGRTQQQADRLRHYFEAQHLFGIPTRDNGILYSTDIDLQLEDIEPSVAGPKRPQDRMSLGKVKKNFHQLLSTSIEKGGYGLQEKEQKTTATTSFQKNNEPSTKVTLTHGSILIAAITSCTNTSNPSVMLAAGLLAKKAVECGMTVPTEVKCSLAPGSRVVTDYLKKANLQPYLDQLGFHLVGYGCTTCIGNSGPLAPELEQTTLEHSLITASVLSGNRNFEARIHPTIKANFLMSPPLVVAFALAGRIDINMDEDPIGKDRHGDNVYLKDLWPTLEEIREEMQRALDPETFRTLYRDFANQNPAWNNIQGTTGATYSWNPQSTYIQEPPFFDHFSLTPGEISEIQGARVLGLFGDSVTTDHISPAGAIKKTSPAGHYLMDHGVEAVAFNSYGSRRGNDQVMTRGTFANVRIKNLLLPGTEGGITKHFPDGKEMSIYQAGQQYQQEGIPLLILAGQEYGTGSSRDWAAKGTRLLGVRAVIAESFERIHRSNLVGMGVLPCCFQEGKGIQNFALDGSEIYALRGLHDTIRPREKLTLEVTRNNGETFTIPLILRIDTPIEMEYYRHGGILPYVLRQLLHLKAPDLFEKSTQAN